MAVGGMPPNASPARKRNRPNRKGVGATETASIMSEKNASKPDEEASAAEAIAEPSCRRSSQEHAQKCGSSQEPDLGWRERPTRISEERRNGCPVDDQIVALKSYRSESREPLPAREVSQRDWLGYVC